jgi:hypothetical protein
MTPDRRFNDSATEVLIFCSNASTTHTRGKASDQRAMLGRQGALEDAAARLVEVMAGPRNMSISAIDQRRLSLAERTTRV